MVKIAVNDNLIHAMEAIGESVALCGRAAYSAYGNSIAQRAYDPPAFTVSLGLKDLASAEEVAHEGAITLPTAAALRADLDWGSIAEVARRNLHNSDGSPLPSREKVKRKL